MGAASPLTSAAPHHALPTPTEAGPALTASVSLFPLKLSLALPRDGQAAQDNEQTWGHAQPAGAAAAAPGQPLACHPRSPGSGASAVSWGCLGGQGHTSPCLSTLSFAVGCSHVLWASPQPFSARSVNSSLAILAQVTESTHTPHFRCLPGAGLELGAGVPVLQGQCRPGLSAAGASSSALPSCPSPARAPPEPPALQGASPWRGLRPRPPAAGTPTTAGGGTEAACALAGRALRTGCLSRRKPECGVGAGAGGQVEEDWGNGSHRTHPKLCPHQASHLTSSGKARQAGLEATGRPREGAGGQARDAAQSSLFTRVPHWQFPDGRPGLPTGMDAGQSSQPGPHPARPQ